MKRDMDVIREILLAIESLPFDGDAHEISISGRSQDVVSYHLKILHEAGLVDALDASSMDGVLILPRSLTWSGHEFLDASRDPSRWAQAKALMVKAGGSLTFEVMKNTLVNIMTTQII